MNLKDVLISDNKELNETSDIIRRAFLIKRIKETKRKINKGILIENWDAIKEKMFYANKKCCEHDEIESDKIILNEYKLINQNVRYSSVGSGKEKQRC